MYFPDSKADCIYIVKFDYISKFHYNTIQFVSHNIMSDIFLQLNYVERFYYIHPHIYTNIRTLSTAQFHPMYYNIHLELTINNSTSMLRKWSTSLSKHTKKILSSHTNERKITHRMRFEWDKF